MKYKNRQTYTSRKGDEAMISFNDILHATKKINPDPVGDIECSFYDYEDICEYSRSLMNTKKKLLIGELYGVKIKIDPMLKPGEYRINNQVTSLINNLIEEKK